MKAASSKTPLENPNSPGRTVNVDAEKYLAVRSAILQALPHSAPGMTVAELKEQVATLVPEHLFPGGDKLGWWLKGVQLDLEAKRVIDRLPTKPLRLTRIASETSDAC
jgi:hypothetical protein